MAMTSLSCPVGDQRATPALTATLSKIELPTRRHYVHYFLTRILLDAEPRAKRQAATRGCRSPSPVGLFRWRVRRGVMVSGTRRRDDSSNYYDHNVTSTVDGYERGTIKRSVPKGHQLQSQIRHRSTFWSAKAFSAASPGLTCCTWECAMNWDGL
jgi:hypothetical protein